MNSVAFCALVVALTGCFEVTTAERQSALDNPPPDAPSTQFPPECEIVGEYQVPLPDVSSLLGDDLSGMEHALCVQLAIMGTPDLKSTYTGCIYTCQQDWWVEHFRHGCCTDLASQEANRCWLALPEMCTLPGHETSPPCEGLILECKELEQAKHCGDAPIEPDCDHCLAPGIEVCKKPKALDPAVRPGQSGG